MATSSSDPDWPLVQALQQGNEDALAEVIEKYEQPLFRFIYRYVGDEETARDVLQETFVRVYFNARKFKPRAKFTTWLHTIAANLCRDFARSSQTRKARLTTSLEVSDPDQSHTAAAAETPAETLLRSERLRALQQAIAELPHKLKTALIHFSLEERSQAECAELLGVTAKTVETRVYRARKILQEKFGEAEG